MSDETPDKQVERTLSAAELAKATGRKGKRSVLVWVAKGLPHSSEPYRGGSRHLFNLEEAKAWLREQGLEEVVQGDQAAAGGAAAPAPASDQAKADDAGDELQDDGRDISGDPLELALGTMLKLARMIDAAARARGMLSSGNAANLARATATASSELRALRKEIREERERAGEVIERVDAEAMVVEAVGLFVADQASLASSLPRRLVAELAAAGVGISDQEAAVRIMTEKLAIESEAIRARRAAWVRLRYARELAAAEPLPEAP